MTGNRWPGPAIRDGAQGDSRNTVKITSVCAAHFLIRLQPSSALTVTGLLKAATVSMSRSWSRDGGTAVTDPLARLTMALTVVAGPNSATIISYQQHTHDLVRTHCDFGLTGRLLASIEVV